MISRSTTFKEFKENHSNCTYCGNKLTHEDCSLDNTESQVQTFVCNNCSSDNFGCRYWFNSKEDSASMSFFIIWNDRYEAWITHSVLFFGFENHNQLWKVIITEHSNMSDAKNYIKNNLRMRKTFAKDEMIAKFFNKECALRWLNNISAEIVSRGNKLIK